eukprot:CAMPEP_0181366060 /NCGR_PEP_ID=MMETSP1106-20121128/10461_1 /TAXON_ID=81844 /ORGANISM="Mantoniella antarctica, Strain SL-175" /LENGTH=41 /DNA_ID= /DNA_START= /DNA_END= /DNA_ORIENTATION=
MVYPCTPAPPSSPLVLGRRDEIYGAAQACAVTAAAAAAAAA